MTSNPMLEDTIIFYHRVATLPQMERVGHGFQWRVLWRGCTIRVRDRGHGDASLKRWFDLVEGCRISDAVCVTEADIVEEW